MARYSLKTLAKARGVRRPTIECRPVEPSLSGEREYRALLKREVIAPLAAFVRAEVIPAYEQEAPQMRQDGLTRDGPSDRFRDIFNAMRALVARLFGAAEEMTERVFRAEADRHTERWAASVRAAMGVDITAIVTAAEVAEPLAIRIAENARLIRSIGEETVSRVERAVYESLNEGASVRGLRRRLTEEIGFEEKRAARIARDQMAKVNSDLSRIRQQEAGVEEYRVSTSRDERVRPLHARLDGTVHRWDRPGPMEGGRHPGGPPLCRCVAIAVVRLD